MRIHALTTGTVRLKRAFLHARSGPRRQLDLALPGPWSGPVPIHCWAIEHEQRLLLVDTGETAAAHDLPFARFEVTERDELPHALAGAGLAIEDVDDVVLTHLHGDHMDGAAHLDVPVRVAADELAFARSARGRLQARLFRQPVPAGTDLRPLGLDAGPFGAFPRSTPLSEDGRIVAVATPGHTAGHLSVVCVDDDGRHVLLAGDATDTLEQLRDRRPDAVAPDPSVSHRTFDVVLRHAAMHPTVYLPSHDPESAARLAAGETISP